MLNEIGQDKKEILQSAIVRALAALIVVFILGLVFNADGAFIKWGTHRDMLRSVSVFGILSCGMTMVILAGGIDLAVGSILAVTAVLFSILSIHYSWPAYLVVPACMIAGILCGIVSGWFVAGFSVQPFIATLAMMVLARGLAKWLSGGMKVTTAIQTKSGVFEYVDLPAIFNVIDTRVLGGNLSVVTLIFLFCLIISWLMLDKLRIGRYIYAIGGNEEAARLSGVPVKMTKLLVYGMSCFFCGIAGMCQAAQETQGDPETGMSYELSAIAMVVIGGTSLNGGRGGIWLTLIGVLTIGYLEKILSINAVGEDKRLMLTGAIILAAVLLQRRKKN